MSLSIIIPVFNEKKFLPKILTKLVKETSRINNEIIIIDDCSTDGSKERLKEISKKKVKYFFYKKKKIILKNLKIYFKNKNEGKGSAIKYGLKNCKKDIVLIQDADLEYDPKDIRKLLDKVNEGNDIVFGNRFHKSNYQNYSYKIFALASYILSKLISLLFLYKINDSAVCYKMFKKDIFTKHILLNEDNFMIDFEIVLKVLKKKANFKIDEVDIYYKGRTFEEGKKISWIDGLRALLLIFRIRLFY